MKTIIAGGRDFYNYELLEQQVNGQKFFAVSEVVSGAARGADSLGEEYASKNNLPLKQFHADWKKHKRAAGIIRNTEMAEYADCLIAFWDGASRGTKHMIQTMLKRKKPAYVIIYDTATHTYVEDRYFI